MKNLILLLLIMIASKTEASEVIPHIFPINAQSQELIGAWSATVQEPGEGEINVVMIIADGYLSTTRYSIANKKFLSTSGGSWKAEGNQIVKTLEFNTSDPAKVGTTVGTAYTVSANSLKFEGDNKTWTRIDYGIPGALAGSWLITGRKRNGELTRRTPGARKTMKILSGTRFQWIAYNTETGEFFGTGGGTYTTENGKYTENIDFFSRDGNRVGDSLVFDFKIELDVGEWHHSGFSSKGDPMFEIWTVRSFLDNSKN